MNGADRLLAQGTFAVFVRGDHAKFIFIGLIAVPSVLSAQGREQFFKYLDLGHN